MKVTCDFPVFDLTFEAAQRIAEAAHEAAENETNEIDNPTDDLRFPDVKIDRY